MSAEPTAGPVLTVVVPAHDEASVIGRCLDALADSTLASRLEVVVAANGCADDTAAVARRHQGRLPRLRVLDLPEPGKTGALDAGDAVATGAARVYLDADVVLSPDAVSGLAAALASPEPLVAAPRIAFDTDGAAWAVRAFYAVFARLPYVADGLVGLGVYGLSPAGRARFDTFPEVIADDLYVQRLFAPAERRTTTGTFTVRTPRTLRALLAVRTRVAAGNLELHRGGAVDTTGSTLDALRALARSPRLWPALAVYVAVQAVARRRAPRTTTRWHRDDSTR